MHVTVATLYDRGRRLPRWREGRPGIAGRLDLSEKFDQASGRTRRTARLIDEGGLEIAELPPLMDATVLYVFGDQMTITGIERLEDERTGMMQHEYAQSWAVLILGERATTG
ncbi:hypothetical protein [Niveibacterium sp.]|uniref:hypothetical protein n=1 Tax=Niveibacterium sp. TaxID=2017444 RepID=UPI0035B1FEEC